MEYYRHAWDCAPSCYLEMLEKLQKHKMSKCQNVTSLSLFYRYYFGTCSSELLQLVSLPYSRERSTHYSDKLHDFSVTIPRCYKDV